MADIYAPAPFFVDPWTTTWLPRHYPVHHHPFEHTRHAIGHGISHAFKGVGDWTNMSASPHALICPTMDVRESETMFYFDVDLPGLKDKKDMALRWVSARTLLLRAVIKRAPTPEDKLVTTDTEKAADEAPKEHNHEHAAEIGPFMTVHERRVGTYGRAFNFPTDVDHEVTVAKLDAGVLRIAVRKSKEDKPIDKKVSVDMGEKDENEDAAKDADDTIVMH